MKYAVFIQFLLLVASMTFLFMGLQTFTFMTIPSKYADQYCATQGQSLLWQSNNIWGRSQVTHTSL